MTRGIRLDSSRATARLETPSFGWEKGAASDRVVAALTERSQSGVACRIVIDAIGSPSFEKDVAPGLARAGCEVHMFRPSAQQAFAERSE